MQTNKDGIPGVGFDHSDSRGCCKSCLQRYSYGSLLKLCNSVTDPIFRPKSKTKGKYSYTNSDNSGKQWLVSSDTTRGLETARRQTRGKGWSPVWGECEISVCEPSSHKQANKLKESTNKRKPVYTVDKAWKCPNDDKPNHTCCHYCRLLFCLLPPFLRECKGYQNPDVLNLKVWIWGMQSVL